MMRTINAFILLCVFCLFCQPTLAQRRVRLADLPPFERAVVVVKYFEGLHGWKNYPYVGYGHQLQLGEHFTADMTERQADSLLRADLMKRLMIFKDYGKDALLLAVLSYNAGAGWLLGYSKHPKSRLLRKIESGNRNFYREFVSFCRYKGKVLRGLVKRRNVEFALFFVGKTKARHNFSFLGNNYVPLHKKENEQNNKQNKKLLSWSDSK